MAYYFITLTHTKKVLPITSFFQVRLQCISNNNDIRRIFISKSKFLSLTINV